MVFLRYLRVVTKWRRFGVLFGGISMAQMSFDFHTGSDNALRVWNSWQHVYRRCITGGIRLRYTNLLLQKSNAFVFVLLTVDFRTTFLVVPASTKLHVVVPAINCWSHADPSMCPQVCHAARITTSTRQLTINELTNCSWR